MLSLPPPETVIADKGYDSEQVRKHITDKGTGVAIPRKSNSIIGTASMNWELYKYATLSKMLLQDSNSFGPLQPDTIN